MPKTSRPYISCESGCGLVSSWKANRHRVGTTFCPECGVRTPMIHLAGADLPESRACSDGPGREIYQMLCPADAALVHDSMLPVEDRYEP